MYLNLDSKSIELPGFTAHEQSKENGMENIKESFKSFCHWFNPRSWDFVYNELSLDAWESSLSCPVSVY